MHSDVTAWSAIIAAMRVLVFGAGVSKRAGYPVAKDLMSALQEYASSQERRIPGARLEWEEWCQLRAGPLAHLRYLLDNPNPEVILSALDLFGAARIARDQADFGGFDRAKLSGDRDEVDRAAKIIRSSLAESRAATAAPLRARAFIVQSLHEFFRYRHRLDANPAAIPEREYLRDLLSTLQPGDVVITFNWDALAERVLGELGKWTPLDGYGLRKKHLRNRGLPLAGPPQSNVKVLKLHGSVGWYWNPSSRAGPALLFDGYTFLRDLGFPSDSEPVGQYPENPLSDPEGPLERYRDDPVMIYPTFIKTIASREIGRLWYLAGSALRRANRIEIYGYSLPHSDGAARVLLNRIRYRSEGRRRDRRRRSVSGNGRRLEGISRPANAV